MITTQVSSALRAATAAVKSPPVAPAVLEVDGFGIPKQPSSGSGSTTSKCNQWEVVTEGKKDIRQQIHRKVLGL